MNVLVIGSGGREHALVWKISQSPKVGKIFCAPGNAGIAKLANCVPIEAHDILALIQFAKSNQIDLTVVGTEVPLVAGIVDQFEANQLKIFGPSLEAARLEGSKVFSKEFMKRHRIPTSNFQIFSTTKKALHFASVLQPNDFPIVIKADGLAAGKGVVICTNMEETEETIIDMIDTKIFKEAGSSIVIEEYLKGEEVSILVISDGEDFVVLDSAQDHKRIFDDDLGPNTGGMGAYSPTDLISPEMLNKISTLIITPTIQGMKNDGNVFKGVLYLGLMLTENGPYVLEYNVRFGDPETQSLLPRLQTDLVDVIQRSIEGGLAGYKLTWDSRKCVSVVMASGGYPGRYVSGKEIIGLNDVEKDVLVFHAGTKTEDQKVVTSGGRVLSVTALGPTIADAIHKAYEGVEKIRFEKCFFRRDIGSKALKKVKV